MNQLSHNFCVGPYTLADLWFPIEWSDHQQGPLLVVEAIEMLQQHQQPRQLQGQQLIDFSPCYPSRVFRIALERSI